MNMLSIRMQVMTLMVFAFVLFAAPFVAQAADLDGYGWGDFSSYDDWGDFSSYDEWGDYSSYDDWGDYSGYTDYYYDDAGYTDYYYDDYAYDYDYGCYDCYEDYYYDYGCYDCYTYTTPGCTFCGGTSYSPPHYSAPSSYFSNVVTNTNTNVNNVTNIDNSINDSFNNYNSGNTSIVVSAPQTPAYSQPAPYCTITHAQYGGYGSGAYLSWTSTNASSAYLTNVGSVSVSGSQTVYGSGTYTLTVYGYNGQQAICSTSIQNTYHPPVYSQPYVSLTQIPYTGFDFGPIGNAMYWAALASFAIAGAYLMVYYRGGALAFATAMVPARRQKFAPIVAPKAPILIENEALAASRDEVKVQPIVAALKKAAGTFDTMAIVTAKDGSMPKIVIQRA